MEAAAQPWAPRPPQCRASRNPGRSNGKQSNIMPHPVLPVTASFTWEDVSIPTRQGVRQRVLLAKGANAGTKAVILFAGGNGTPITIPEGAGHPVQRQFSGEKLCVLRQ